MTNEKVYIHEYIDINGQNRAKYFQHITANWSPTARAERDQLCFGVWGTLGSTGRWPGIADASARTARSMAWPSPIASAIG